MPTMARFSWRALLLASVGVPRVGAMLTEFPMHTRSSAYSPGNQPPLHVMASSRPAYLPLSPQERPVDAFAVSEDWTWEQLSKGAQRAAAGYLACHVGYCDHYDVESLLNAQHPVTQPKQYIQKTGRMRQTVQFDDELENAIQVWSVFEEGVVSSSGGISNLGPLVSRNHEVETRAADNLRQVKSTAKRGNVDSIVVSPGDCVFSGDRVIRGGEVEFQLWLSEKSGATHEALRLGLGLTYGKNGQLQHVTRMRQLALRDPDEITGSKMCSPRFAASQAVRSSLNPDLPCNFGILEQAVGQLAVFAENNINSAQGDQLLSGVAIADIIAASPWKTRRARMCSTGGDDATAFLAWEASMTDGQGNGSAGWSPTAGSIPGEEHYLDIRFEDGVYAKMPRAVDSLRGESCFELGCLRSAALATGSFMGPLAGMVGSGASSMTQPALQNDAVEASGTDDRRCGGLHRMLVMADKRGTIHTQCYEVYTE